MCIRASQRRSTSGSGKIKKENLRIPQRTFPDDQLLEETGHGFLACGFRGRVGEVLGKREREARKVKVVFSFSKEEVQRGFAQFFLRFFSIH